MLTDAVPWIRALVTITTDRPTAARSVSAFMREGLCALRGHDFFVGVEPRRLFLRCARCGHHTRGWALDRPRYRSSTGRT
jgi:hypothetical protein